MDAQSRAALDNMGRAYVRSLWYRLLVVVPFIGIVVLRGSQLGILTPILLGTAALIAVLVVGMAFRVRHQRQTLEQLLSEPQPSAQCRVRVFRPAVSAVCAAELWRPASTDDRPAYVVFLGSGQRLRLSDGTSTVWGPLRARAVIAIERDGEFLWPTTTALGRIRQWLLFAGSKRRDLQD